MIGRILDDFCPVGLETKKQGIPFQGLEFWGVVIGVIDWFLWIRPLLWHFEIPLDCWV